MPWPSPAFPLVRAKIRSYGALWMPVFQVFSPLIRQPLPSRTAVVSMCVASEPWSGSVMPKAKPARPSSEGVDPLRLLGRRAVVQHQQQADVVADDRVLVLQIVVQPEPLGGQVLADDGHVEVRAVPPAVLLRVGVAIVARGIGTAPGLGEQRLPLLPGQAAPLPVGARVLAAVIEEADVVVAAASSGSISRAMKASSSSR